MSSVPTMVLLKLAHLSTDTELAEFPGQYSITENDLKCFMGKYDKGEHKSIVISATSSTTDQIPTHFRGQDSFWSKNYTGHLATNDNGPSTAKQVKIKVKVNFQIYYHTTNLLLPYHIFTKLFTYTYILG